jgi:hypothetical protein
LWESGKHPEWNGKGPGDAYGAEHLCRILGQSCLIFFFFSFSGGS